MRWLVYKKVVKTQWILNLKSKMKNKKVQKLNQKKIKKLNGNNSMNPY